MSYVYVTVMETEREKFLLEAFKSKADARRFCVQTFLNNTNMDTPADIQSGYQNWDGEEVSFCVNDSYLRLSSIEMYLE